MGYRTEKKGGSVMNKEYCNICKVYANHDDIYDCQEHYEVKNGIRKGQWMIDWMIRKNKMTKQKTDSRFVKWSKSVSKSLIVLLMIIVGCEDKNEGDGLAYVIVDCTSIQWIAYVFKAGY